MAGNDTKTLDLSTVAGKLVPVVKVRQCLKLYSEVQGCEHTLFLQEILKSVVKNRRGKS